VRLLAQVRKYRGAIAIAHQHLDQLPASARAGVFANSSIKLAGGISAKDATVLAPEMRTKAEHLLSFHKDNEVSRFALFAKNYTDTAMTLEVPLGLAERCERLTGEEYAALIEQSLDCYGRDVSLPVATVHPDVVVQPDISPATTVPGARTETPLPPVTEPLDDQPQDEVPQPEPIFRKEGGGGVRHSEIERLIKELGEAAGYRASLEETILDGLGRVDVILRRDDQLVCCEVSVTTSREHEYLNVRKCLDFGATKVLLIANTERHLKSLTNYITPRLSEHERSLVMFLSPDELAALFATVDNSSAPAPKIVRGYRVSSRVEGDNPSPSSATRKAIAAILDN
jgi:hypothetical protein